MKGGLALSLCAILPVVLGGISAVETTMPQEALIPWGANPGSDKAIGNEIFPMVRNLDIVREAAETAMLYGMATGNAWAVANNNPKTIAKNSDYLIYPWCGSYADIGNVDVAAGNMAACLLASVAEEVSSVPGTMGASLRDQAQYLAVEINLATNRKFISQRAVNSLYQPALVKPWDRKETPWISKRTMMPWYPIQGDHFSDLKSAMAAVYDFKGAKLPNFVDPPKEAEAKDEDGQSIAQTKLTAAKTDLVSARLSLSQAPLDKKYYWTNEVATAERKVQDAQDALNKEQELKDKKTGKAGGGGSAFTFADDRNVSSIYAAAALYDLAVTSVPECQEAKDVLGESSDPTHEIPFPTIKVDEITGVPIVGNWKPAQFDVSTVEIHPEGVWAPSGFQVDTIAPDDGYAPSLIENKTVEELQARWKYTAREKASRSVSQLVTGDYNWGAGGPGAMTTNFFKSAAVASSKASANIGTVPEYAKGSEAESALIRLAVSLVLKKLLDDCQELPAESSTDPFTLGKPAALKPNNYQSLAKTCREFRTSQMKDFSLPLDMSVIFLLNKAKKSVDQSEKNTTKLVGDIWAKNRTRFILERGGNYGYKNYWFDKMVHLNQMGKEIQTARRATCEKTLSGRAMCLAEAELSLMAAETFGRHALETELIKEFEGQFMHLRWRRVACALAWSRLEQDNQLPTTSMATGTKKDWYLWKRNANGPYIDWYGTFMQSMQPKVAKFNLHESYKAIGRRWIQAYLLEEVAASAFAEQYLIMMAALRNWNVCIRSGN